MIGKHPERNEVKSKDAAAVVAESLVSPDAFGGLSG